MEQFQRGDLATVITYNVMTPENATGNRFTLKLTVKSNAEITKAGAKQVTVKGGLSDSNYSRSEIGKPVSGFFRSTFNVLVPKGANTDTYIEKAKQHMRNSIKSTQEQLLAGIEVAKAEAERESEWLKIKELSEEQ